MEEFFGRLFDKVPGIIHEAAQSALGVTSLSILVLGGLGFFLFRKAPARLKVAAFAMLTSGLLGFTALVIVLVSNPNAVLNPPQPNNKGSERNTVGKQAKAKLDEANHLALAGGHNDQARENFIEARSLYEQENNRSGQADALLGLGILEAKFSSKYQAQNYLDQALSLYKQENNRSGQADAVNALGTLEFMLGHADQARARLEEANMLYSAAGKRSGQANVRVGARAATLSKPGRTFTELSSSINKTTIPTGRSPHTSGSVSSRAH
jgi:tetratricopeptide (TPR) repeat protein